jgi:DNA invertase Pin-like site-specific DNA recombinase
MPVRAAIYCRISEDRVGAGLGVERQHRDCLEIAQHRNWQVFDTYTDNAGHITVQEEDDEDVADGTPI